MRWQRGDRAIWEDREEIEGGDMCVVRVEIEGDDFSEDREEIEGDGMWEDREDLVYWEAF